MKLADADEAAAVYVGWHLHELQGELSVPVIIQHGSQAALVFRCCSCSDVGEVHAVSTGNCWPRRTATCVMCSLRNKYLLLDFYMN